MKEKLEVDEIKMTTSSCPTQWEGKTTEGDDLYIRYRNGVLRIDKNGRAILSMAIGGPFDGMINLNKVIELTEGFIKWEGYQYA